MSTNIYKTFFFWVFLLASLYPALLQAQLKQDQSLDTLAPYRSFLNACQASKSLPLQLQLEVRHTTNVVTATEDTAAMQGLFHVNENAAYVRFGELEQFVSDSLALLVSNRLQRMLVYENARPFLKQLQAVAVITLTDSGVMEMAKRYVVQLTEENGVTTISLQHRLQLPAVGLPGETITLQLRTATKQLLAVTATRRTLIPVSVEDAGDLRKDSSLARFLVSQPDKGTFLLKEQTTTYLYHSIRHEPGVAIPVSIGERIQKGSDGNYSGAKGYENYAVTLN